MRSFPVSILNSQETLTLADRVAKIIEDMPEGELKLIQLVKPALRTASQNLIDALAKDPKCEFTPLLDTQDSVFDTAFMTFRDFMQMMAKQKDPRIAGPARKVEEVVERIGNTIHRLGYTEQLARTSMLLGELGSEQYQQAIDTCGARVWYDQLAEADATLRALFTERNEDTAGSELQNVKSTKTALKHHLRAIYYYIEELDTLEPQTYGIFASRFDEALGAVIPTARMRRTNRENGDEDSGVIGEQEQDVQEGELQA